MRISRKNGVSVFAGLVAVGVVATISVDAKSDRVDTGIAVPVATTYTAPTSTYRQPDSSVYLDLLAAEGFDYVDSATAVTVGEAVCDLLDVGGSVAMAARIAVNEGLTGEDAGVFIGAAVTTLCPEHRPELEEFIAANGGGR